MKVQELASLLQGRPVYLMLSRDHDQWYAEAVDYEIVGVGDTRDEARDASLRLLQAYLRSIQSRGGDEASARHRRGPLTTLKVHVLSHLPAFMPDRWQRAQRITLN